MAEFSELALPDLDRLNGLSEAVNGGHLVGSVDEVFSPELREILTALNVSIATGTAHRREVTAFVQDVLLAASAVPTRTRRVKVRNNLIPSHRHDLRELTTLTPRRAAQVLARLETELRLGQSPPGTLASIEYDSRQPMAQRSARLALLNLWPQARAELLSDPLFRQLLDHPQLLWEARFAAVGAEEQYFLSTCVPATVNQHLRSQAPTIAGLLLIGRALAQTINNQLAAANNPLLERFDRLRDRRTVRELIVSRVRDAQQQFDELEITAHALLIDSRSLPQAQLTLRQLTLRWSRTMQKLSPLLLAGVKELRSVAVLTPKLISDQWVLSTFVSPQALLDRPLRRLAGVEEGMYQAAIPSVVDHLHSPTASVSAWLQDGANQHQRLMQLWHEVRSVGGVMLGLPLHAAYLKAVRFEGAQLFAIGDPERANFELMTPATLAQRCAHWEIAPEHLSEPVPSETDD